MLLGTTRTASVRATQPTVLIRLTMEAFFELLAAFPDEESSLREEAVRRLQADLERIKRAQLKNAARGLKAGAAMPMGGTGGPPGSLVQNRRGNVTAISAAQMVIMARIVQLQTAKLGEYGADGMPEASRSGGGNGDSASDSGSSSSSSDSDSDASPARAGARRGPRLLPPPLTVPAPQPPGGFKGRRSPFVSPKHADSAAADAAGAVVTPPAFAFDTQSAYPLSAAAATAAAAAAAAAATAASVNTGASPTHARGGRLRKRHSSGRRSSGGEAVAATAASKGGALTSEEFKEAAVAHPASPSRTSPAFFIPGDMSQVQSQSRLLVRAPSRNRRISSVDARDRDRESSSSFKISSPVHGGYLPGGAVSPLHQSHRLSPSHASLMHRGDSAFQLPGRTDDLEEDDSPAKKQQRMVQLLRATSTRRQNTGNSLLLPPTHFSTGSSSSLLVPPRSADKRHSLGIDVEASTNSNAASAWAPSPSQRSRPGSPRLSTANKEAAAAKSDLLARLANTSTRALLAESVSRAAAAAATAGDNGEDSPKRSGRPDGARNSGGGASGPSLARYGTVASNASQVSSPVVAAAGGGASPRLALGRGLSSPSLAPMQSSLNLLALPLDPAAASVRRVSLREEEQLDVLAQLRMRRDNTVKRSSLGQRGSGGAGGVGVDGVDGARLSGGGRSSGGWRGSGGAGGSSGQRSSGGDGGGGGMMASIRAALKSVPAAAQDSAQASLSPQPAPAGNQIAPRANDSPSPRGIPPWLAQRVSSRGATLQSDAKGASPSPSQLQQLPPQYPRRSSGGQPEGRNSSSPPMPQRTTAFGAAGLTITMGSSPPLGSPARSARDSGHSPPPSALPPAAAAAAQNARFTPAHAPLQRQGAQIFQPPVRSGSLPVSPENDYRRLGGGRGGGGSGAAVSLPLSSSDAGFRPLALRGTSTTSGGSGTATPVRTPTRPSSGTDVLSATATPGRVGRSNKVTPRPLNAF